MISRIPLLSAATALCISLSFVPAAYAADDAAQAAKPPAGNAMMHKDAMKETKKHKDSMMHSNSMKKDEAPPAQ